MASSATPFIPKAIIFDLLTALLDSWTLWDESTPTGTAAEGRKWRERYLELTFGQGAYVPYSTLVTQAADDVNLPRSAPEALLRDWYRLAAWPEVGDVLVRLKSKGYKLGVITNCSLEGGTAAVRNAEKAAADKGHGKFEFDATITAEESGFYKPVQQAYQAILPRLGVAVDEVLFVAGSNGDVEGATSAGFKVVWHNKVGLPKKGQAEPLREGRTLNEALEAFL
ncbi:had-superfamily subfamily variant 2 protein [Colletotrichum karsti]|uniref:Had-superfamily subfamily variant 2 protein n=1 Tax=Colletotrichum karsti TaxID=1095194 RepID=A0A9P6I7K0_9PEZI|nr:had-superfamily subfamily variant 2 protein [Colletotrichum karsti]KAF9877207.1 had-superfamily subfamily variant 2 protein [Colletotrichum karsti]